MNLQKRRRRPVDIVKFEYYFKLDKVIYNPN